MLGSQEMAESSKNWYYNNVVVPWEEGSQYKVLGAGVSRTAILCPDGIVYKVSRGSGQTQNEAEFFALLEEFEIRWRPEFTYYADDGIMAMRKYEQPWIIEGYVVWQDREEAFNDWLDSTDPDNRKRWNEMGKVVSDLHHNNVAMDNRGMLVLIDGGFSGYGDDRGALERLAKGRN